MIGQVVALVSSYESLDIDESPLKGVDLGGDVGVAKDESDVVPLSNVEYRVDWGDSLLVLDKLPMCLLSNSWVMWSSEWELFDPVVISELSCELLTSDKELAGVHLD